MILQSSTLLELVAIRREPKSDLAEANTNMAREIPFFFFIGSTYTYLSVNRVEALAAERGIEIRWRPFSVVTLMAEQNNSSFSDNPVKMQYMWRDIERRAKRHGLPYLPTPIYPARAPQLVNRVATIAANEGWCPELVRLIYRRWFLDGKNPGDRAHVSEALALLGKDPGVVLAMADSEEVKAKYLAVTDAARQLGIFGSPTFSVGGEIFWGDDRLEDALLWCTQNVA